MKKTLKTIILLAVAAAVVYIGLKVVKSYTSKDKAKVVFRTEEVTRTDVIRSISAMEDQGGSASANANSNTPAAVPAGEQGN